jgi:hypothetical protein
LLPHYSDQPIRAVRLIVEHESKYLLIQHPDESGTSGSKWGLPGDSTGRDANGLLLLEDEALRALKIELPWATYIGDFDEADRRCRVFAYLLPADDVAQSAHAAWFAHDEISGLASEDRLMGGYEMNAIDQWLDSSFLRGIGQSKRQAIKDSQSV